LPTESLSAQDHHLTISLRANSMLKINKLNKASTLLTIGVFSAALPAPAVGQVSAALWAWMWHYQGLSIISLRAGHGVALFFYLVSLVALIVFITRLRGRRLGVAALALSGANGVLWIADWLINQYYFQFFALAHPFPIQAYDSRYVHNWRMFFLEPFLLLLQLGMFLFWLASLACLIWRAVWSSPERRNLSPTQSKQ
jgi:hypothetical protein